MGTGYKLIDWNRQKQIYDGIMLGLMALYLLVFAGGNMFMHPNITTETLLIRSTGTLAILMLHVILIIGPLSRLIPQAKILLYNRRHLGVTMFLVSLIHGVFSIVQYHGGGNKNPLISLFTSNTDYFSFAGFPFMVLGFFGLVILFSMAATSHDFWLNKLSPLVWKRLHMMVYLAYVLLVFHVLLGTLQNDNSVLGFLTLFLGVGSVVGLHIAAGLRNRKEETLVAKATRNDGFVYACKSGEIADNCAKLLTYKGVSIAIFKKGKDIYAVDNFCQHQGGPLSEGKIIDGCITCPWHGWQYRPEDGQSPPPFDEKIATYEVMLEGEGVYVKCAKRIWEENVD